MSKLHVRSRVSRIRIPSLVVDSFEIRCLEIKELHIPVRNVQVFTDEVAASIEQDGMANPVIVVRGPREDLVQELRQLGSEIKNLSEAPVLNCVYGGTNRVFAAKQLGYTHVDCVLLPSFHLGLKLQNLQRESYYAGKATAVGAT